MSSANFVIIIQRVNSESPKSSPHLNEKYAGIIYHITQLKLSHHPTD